MVAAPVRIAPYKKGSRLHQKLTFLVFLPFPETTLNSNLITIGIVNGSGRCHYCMDNDDLIFNHRTVPVEVVGETLPQAIDVN